MPNSSKMVIFISLMIMVVISPSLGHREISDVEKELRDLVSQTDEPKKIWNIIKPELGRFTDADPKIVADVILDLAITRGDEIHEQLNRLHEDSRNDELKRKYLLCSKNYDDAIRNLKLAKTNLGSDDINNISVEIDDTIQELNSCRVNFEGHSFDPAHIRNRQKEFGNYVKIVKVATDRLLMLEIEGPMPEIEGPDQSHV